MSESICLDASVLLKLYIPEPGSREARELVATALSGGGRLVGPAFLSAEALSVLRGQVHRGRMVPEDAEESVDALLALPIEHAGGPEVYRRAWEIAEELAMPTIYDAAYLAVAEQCDATFWTADRKLLDRARSKPYVRLLNTDVAETP